MKIHRFGKVVQLAFFESWFPVNCYLVEEEDGMTLIDAGMPGFAKRIAAAVEASGRPLKRILLTHAHADHIGAVPALKSAYPEARLGISERDARLLAADWSLDSAEPQTRLRGGVPKKPGPAPDLLFRDGETIGSLTVAACPGHTPGHVAFWHTESDTLIAGDAVSTRGGLAVSGYVRLSFPFPAWATWHRKTAIASAEKLAEMLPKRLAVGHGPVLENPGETLKRSIREAKVALEGRRRG